MLIMCRFPCRGRSFEKTKRTKSLFATNQPCGLLRNFEFDHSGGSRKQPSMADSALRAILALRPTSVLKLKTD